MEAIEGSSYDAYVGMVVSDAIEHSRDDNFINECEWLERHGFIRTISLDNVCFKNQHFKICDQYYSVMVQYDAVNKCWTCTSCDRRNDLWTTINFLFREWIPGGTGRNRAYRGTA